MYQINPPNHSTTYNPREISALSSVEENFTIPERIQSISNNDNHFTGGDELARPPRKQPTTSEHLLQAASLNPNNYMKESIVRKKLDERIDGIRKKLSLISFDLPAEPTSTSDYSIHRLICNRADIRSATPPDTPSYRIEE